MSTARELMSQEPIFCTPETALITVAKMMVEFDCGEIPVVETLQNPKPVGVVTDRDICCRAVAQGKNPKDLTAEDCMSMPCVTVGENDSIETICEVMEENKIRRVVVVTQAGTICGIISQADIARVDLDKTSDLVAELSEASPTPSDVENVASLPS